MQEEGEEEKNSDKVSYTLEIRDPAQQLNYDEQKSMADQSQSKTDTQFNQTQSKDNLSALNSQSQGGRRAYQDSLSKHESNLNQSYKH